MTNPTRCVIWQSGPNDLADFRVSKPGAFAGTGVNIDGKEVIAGNMIRFLFRHRKRLVRQAAQAARPAEAEDFPGWEGGHECQALGLKLRADRGIVRLFAGKRQPLPRAANAVIDRGIEGQQRKRGR